MSGSTDFLHGGNSLQERLIPVLVASYSHAPGKDLDRYRVSIAEIGLERGLHVVTGRLTAEKIQTPLYLKTELDLVLHAMDTPDVSIVLVEAVGARLEKGGITAPLNEDFRVLFRLAGPAPSRTRVILRAATTDDTIEGEPSVERLSVDVIGPVSAHSDSTPPVGDDWLGSIEEPARRVLAHIQQYGAINEADATAFLGGPSRFRQFSRKIDEYAKKAPFRIRVDASSGTKRYVREDG